MYILTELDESHEETFLDSQMVLFLVDIANFIPW